MNDKLNKLKDMGFKMTAQRRGVLEYLEGNKSHPSVNDIYENLKEKFPDISLATVYNTVDTLVKNGLLQELSIAKDKSNYDPDVSLHDHAYCLNCGRIFDISADIKPETSLKKMDGLKGFKIISVRKIYRVLCDTCRKN